ncbi:MAG: PLP-dependent aminotransferase family protein [Rhodoferax sp.]|uniref:aminotransferase-like domain-containing protein n=1 Tax=Rhodoferax sp. TaxID=50421 RepID=UPI0008CD443A|nr:PLP-dependent aminotransferase family protein [Rhodoferax sp.]MDP2678239.1 PLP-dependent aminotransferase family protein [Rhodoferax sp.]OGB53090.1 MAG: 2-aminoadipate aminotransferase [Burkholderiales bacterium RIFOXYD12_FULL_59_19]
MTTSTSSWHLARRAARMNPSVIREILKVTEKPGIISFAGGLPSSKTFPVTEFEAACAKVLKDDPAGALQYAASEGYGPLREMVAHRLPWNVDPAQVLITTGSQQGLDLVAKVLIDADSKILVESPTYLGAVMAFIPMEPKVVSVASDEHGVDIADLSQKADDARFLYVLPNFQNPTGNTMSESRRGALSELATQRGLPLIEDNPYGDLWFDVPPPAPLTARNPDGCIYLGSFSKVLAPGLRLGFVVAPKAVYPKLLQAKQAADLHSPGFNQRMIAEVMKDGFLERHVPTIRALYKAQRDAMLEALAHEMPAGDPDSTLTWNTPAGGMFLWARLPKGMSAVDLLPFAVEQGVAFVPGAPFYADHGDARTLRLSFVTPSVDEIHRGVASLAVALKIYAASLQV